MLVKTYRGSNEREALSQAKDELGPDIMLINTKTIRGTDAERNGERLVEVTVSSDVGEEKPRRLNVFDIAKQRLDERAELLPRAMQQAEMSEADIAELFFLRKQMRSMKAQLRSQRTNPFGEPFNFCYSLLTESGTPHQMAESLIQQTELALVQRARAAHENTTRFTRGEALDELKHQIHRLFPPIPSDSRSGRQEIVSVIGPSGAGKSSLIAKLAGHKNVYRNRNVAVITTDIYRAGGTAGLKSLGKIMSIPIIEVRQSEDLQRAMRNLLAYDVILVDTPGRSPLRKGSLQELQTQLAIVKPTETILVLSANMGIEELWLFMGLYQGAHPTALAVTKLDETSRPGKVLGLADSKRLVLKYITQGQAIPQSLSMDVGQSIINHLPLAAPRR